MKENNPAKRSEIKDKISKKLKERFANDPEYRKKVKAAAIRRIQDALGPWKNTKPELAMKQILLSLKIPFIYQCNVPNIQHIFDFGVTNSDILVEVDGNYWHKREGRRKKDYAINRIAKREGYCVLRFWEKDILEHTEKIIKKLKEAMPWAQL